MPNLAQQPLSASPASLAEIARAAEAKHPDFADHARRVAALAAAMAGQAGWEPTRVSEMHRAALLHDIGKIAVPDRIIGKVDPLTDAERAQLQTHPAIGAEMLAGALSEDQVAWVRHHHERWDGAGYPDHLKGRTIPEGAQLLSMADAYDAMTHERPYRKALTHEVAILEARAQAATHFAPCAVEVLEQVLASRVWVS